MEAVALVMKILCEQCRMVHLCDIVIFLAIFLYFQFSSRHYGQKNGKLPHKKNKYRLKKSADESIKMFVTI